MKSISRRTFTTGVLASGTALALGPLAQARGANDDIRVAVVGIRGHGRSHIRNYQRLAGVRVVALCDADRAVLTNGVRDLDRQGVKVAAHTDLRKLLDRKDVDAVSTATPNHWHSLLTVWACQAGKDVCVEKPVSHNVWEGRKMVEAARKYDRVVQADLDQRSRTANDEIAAFLRQEGLGRIVLARGWCYKYRPSIGKTNGRGRIPESIDYDLWCGPARKDPIDRRELHYDWHWVWNTGCGEIGNNGPHQLDLIRWMLAERGLPRRAMSLGGRFGYDDAGETPNTQISFFDYATAPVIYEVRGLPHRPGTKQMDTYRAVSAQGRTLENRWKGSGPNTGIIIQCEEGYVDLSSHTAFDAQGKEIRKFTGESVGPSRDPQANFIRAVRSRKPEDRKTDIEEGHLSTCLCHLGNISYRTGKSASSATVREAMRDDRDGLEAYGRFLEHLAVHEIDLDKRAVTLGPWLALRDGEERFAGPFADAANRLLRREYRHPFVIPDRV